MLHIFHHSHPFISYSYSLFSHHSFPSLSCCFFLCLLSGFLYLYSCFTAIVFLSRKTVNYPFSLQISLHVRQLLSLLTTVSLYIFIIIVISFFSKSSILSGKSLFAARSSPCFSSERTCLSLN